jgi:hypothetical protein
MAMDEMALREKVGQLLSEVRHLPTVEPDVVGVRAGEVQTSAMKREMAALEDNLDHIRLAIKYLVFDLEATKRENRLLREMLGDQ